MKYKAHMLDYITKDILDLFEPRNQAGTSRDHREQG
jgi:hypothetical protein